MNDINSKKKKLINDIDKSPKRKKKLYPFHSLYIIAALKVCKNDHKLLKHRC